MSNSSICPIARKAELTIEELAPETVVYDHKRNRMLCLNQSTSFIWRCCDGQARIEEIAAMLPEAGLPGDVDVVRRALKILERAHLLEGEPAFETSELPSRRQLVRRLGLAAGTAAAILPAITSAVAPTPAMAKSRDQHDLPVTSVVVPMPAMKQSGDHDDHDKKSKKPKKPKKNYNDLEFFE